VGELVDSGYLTRHRVGRRNSYTVHPDVALRHPLEADHTVGDLLTAVGEPVVGRVEA
jgi:hypothetical protein